MLSVAAGPKGVVVAVTNGVVFDVPSLLPGVDITNGYEETPDGISVIGPPVAGPCDGSVSVAMQSASGECYIAQGPSTPYTWDQLGIGTKVRDSINDPFAFWFSPDGITFTPVDTPAPNPGSPGQLYISALVSTDLGFVAQVSTRGVQDVGNMLLTSPDGMVWSRAAPVPLDALYVLGSVNGLIAGVRQRQLRDLGG